MYYAIFENKDIYGKYHRVWQIENSPKQKLQKP